MDPTLGALRKLRSYEYCAQSKDKENNKDPKVQSERHTRYQGHKKPDEKHNSDQYYDPTLLIGSHDILSMIDFAKVVSVSSRAPITTMRSPG